MNPTISKKLQKIDKLLSEVEALRNECPHENFTGKYKSNTGNWYPGDDSYWIDAKCSDCGRVFSADSKEDAELYRKLSLSGKIER